MNLAATKYGPETLVLLIKGGHIDCHLIIVSEMLHSTKIGQVNNHRILCLLPVC